MTGPRLSIIPAGAVLDRRLKARDLQVLCVFGKHSDRNGWCCRSQVKMAREMDCARSTVQASIERLVAAGWLQRRMHSVPHEAGERDSAHEYRVVLDVPDEAQDVVSTLPTDRHPLPTHGSAPPADSGSAPINDPSLTDPPPTLRASAREGDFSSIWEGWPIGERPDNRDAAEAAFRKLAPRERMLAIEHAVAYRTLMARRGKPPRIFVYLRSRAFEELDDAPPIDSSGDFIIRPGRPEWPEWLGWFRSNHGERGVESIVRLGFCKVKTRWPQRQTEAA